jgi:hypothetical protein
VAGGWRNGVFNINDADNAVGVLPWRSSVTVAWLYGHLNKSEKKPFVA